jgi:hypothetical protein
LATLEKEEYLVVTGAKGIGKSCVVETATRYTCGVVRVSVNPGASSDEIVKKSLMEVVNCRIPFADYYYYHSARRVLFWYGLIAKAPPILVLCVAERIENGKFAQIPSAARELANLGLRVLIEGSTNSVPIEALNTIRDVVLELDPMPEQVIAGISEYHQLLEELKSNGLYDVVWSVIGGVPAHFKRLNKKWKNNGHKHIEKIVDDYVGDLLGKSISKVNVTLAKYLHLESILNRFEENSHVPLTVLREEKTERPSPDKILRTVMRNKEVFLVPIDSSMAFVLQTQLRQTPSLKELKEIVSSNISV